MSSSIKYGNHFYHIKWPPLNVTIFITNVRNLHNGCYTIESCVYDKKKNATKTIHHLNLGSLLIITSKHKICNSHFCVCVCFFNSAGLESKKCVPIVSSCKMIFSLLISEVEKEKENTVWLEQSIMTKQGYNLYLCVLFWKPPAGLPVSSGLIIRGGSRISGKGVHIYRGSLCWFYLIFLKYPMKMK